jgi:hypothetical protein
MQANIQLDLTGLSDIYAVVKYILKEEWCLLGCYAVWLL